MSPRKRQTHVPKNWQMSGFISTTLMSGRQVTTCWCPIVLVYILGLEDFTDLFPCWKQIHRFSAEQHLQMRRTVPPGRAQAGGLAPTRRYQLWARNPSSRAQTPIDSNSDFSIAVWSKLQSVSVQHAKFICQNSKLKKNSDYSQTPSDFAVGPFDHCFLVLNVP